MPMVHTSNKIDGLSIIDHLPVSFLSNLNKDKDKEILFQVFQTHRKNM